MARIFYLNIFSGEVHIINSGRDDGDDEILVTSRPPRMKDLRPNTKELDVSTCVII